MHKTTIAVLRGGTGCEHDVSMETGSCVLASLEAHDFDIKSIYISKTGEWIHEGFTKDPYKVLCDVDLVFIALHGEYGEDGTVQRFLDRLFIPYVGSGPYASAVAMNKESTKKHIEKLDILTPRHMRIKHSQITDPFQTALSVGELFGTKYLVKPTFGGSSMGAKIANNVNELGSVLKTLLTEYDDLLIEEYISGIDATVGVLENYRNKSLYHLPSVEIIPDSDLEFFDTEAKYNKKSHQICPGRFTRKEKGKMADIATSVHSILNLQQYSRSDFIVSPNGVYFLEVNTLPGLTKESLFPTAMDAIGGEYDELILHLITQAQHNRKVDNV